VGADDEYAIFYLLEKKFASKRVRAHGMRSGLLMEKKDKVERAAMQATSKTPQVGSPAVVKASVRTDEKARLLANEKSGSFQLRASTWSLDPEETGLWLHSKTMVPVGERLLLLSGRRVYEQDWKRGGERAYRVAPGMCVLVSDESAPACHRRRRIAQKRITHQDA
jgi:hypothetical protein